MVRQKNDMTLEISEKLLASSTAGTAASTSSYQVKPFSSIVSKVHTLLGEYLLRRCQSQRGVKIVYLRAMVTGGSL